MLRSWICLDAASGGYVQAPASKPREPWMPHTGARYQARLRRDVLGVEGITAYSEPLAKFAIQNETIETSEGDGKMPY